MEGREERTGGDLLETVILSISWSFQVFYHHNIFQVHSLHLGIKGENRPEVNKS